MLAAHQSQKLFGILSVDSAKFDESLKKFEQQFAKSEYFAAGWVMQHMIQNNLLNLKQRLVALYILYEIYLHENVKTTPFYQLVLDLLSSAESLHVAEQKLLSDFLKSVPRVGKQTPAEYIMEVEQSADFKFAQDLEPYRKAHAENMPLSSSLQKAQIPRVLNDGGEALTDAPHKVPLQELLDKDELMLQEFGPANLRPLPHTSSEYLIHDVQWLLPELHSEVNWDYALWEETEEQKLAKKALKEGISKLDELRLIEALKLDPALVYEWGFTPSVLSKLVDSYLELSFSIFFYLNPYPEVTEYYFELFELPLSKNSVKLVFLLREQIDVPVVGLMIQIAREIEAEMVSGPNYEDRQWKGKLICNYLGRLIKEDPLFTQQLQAENMPHSILIFCNKFHLEQETDELKHVIDRYIKGASKS